MDPANLIAGFLQLRINLSVNAVTRSNLVRLLWSETLITWCIPKFFVVDFDGVRSVSSSMANVVVCTSVGFHTGHSVSKGSHDGPSLHSVDVKSSCEVIPLVRRSAGFSEVGQYFHEVVEDSVVISSIRCETNCFSFFLLLIQCRTIWLSDHR